MNKNDPNHEALFIVPIRRQYFYIIGHLIILYIVFVLSYGRSAFFIIANAAANIFIIHPFYGVYLFYLSIRLATQMLCIFTLYKMWQSIQVKFIYFKISAVIISISIAVHTINSVLLYFFITISKMQYNVLRITTVAAVSLIAIIMMKCLSNHRLTQQVSRKISECK